MGEGGYPDPWQPFHRQRDCATPGPVVSQLDKLAPGLQLKEEGMA
jgi:hypothetical protein